MSDYKPTEYVVDFGDYRSNAFVKLSMALIEQNGAKLQEQIIRCADCVYAHDKTDSGYWCNTVESRVQPDDFCSWGKRGTWRLEDEY